MKFCSYLLVLALGLALGYYVVPIISPGILLEEPLTRAEHYATIINIVVAIGTIAAVVVALFQNEIRSWFKKVTFKTSLISEDIIEDLITDNDVKKAAKYHNHIQFVNDGNINAQNCELYLETAEFCSDNGGAQSVPVGNDPIVWNNIGGMVYIPSQGKKVLPIFEITAPQKSTNPDRKSDTVKPSEYILLGLPRMEAQKGVWELTYCLYSINSKPHRFKFTVDWNGEWEIRQTEMKKILKLKVETL